MARSHHASAVAARLHFRLSTSLAVLACMLFWSDGDAQCDIEVACRSGVPVEVDCADGPPASLCGRCEAPAEASNETCESCIETICENVDRIAYFDMSFEFTHAMLTWAVLLPFLCRLSDWFFVALRNFLAIPKRRVVVVSCPEFGTLDPAGGEPYDQAVMEAVQQLQERGLVKMGYDRAGTTTTTQEDVPLWAQIKEQQELGDIEGAKATIRRTRWFYGYQTGVKRVLSTECQVFEGVVEVVCIRGGIVTQVEQEAMDAIIVDAQADGKRSGVECRIQQRTLSYAEFRKQYGLVGVWRWLGWLVPRSVRAANYRSTKGVEGGGDGLLVEQRVQEKRTQGFLMSDLRKKIGWAEVCELNGQSEAEARRSAALRLVFWHWMQPMLYFVVWGYCVSGYYNIDDQQQVLGWGVCLREFIYLAMTLVVLRDSPQFLLVNCSGTVAASPWDPNFLDVGYGFLLMYVLAPEKFMATVIMTVYSLKYSKYHNAIWYSYIGGGVVLVFLDMMGIGALASGLASRNMPLPLAIGYGATTLGGLTFFVLTAVGTGRIQGATNSGWLGYLAGALVFVGGLSVMGAVVGAAVWHWYVGLALGGVACVSLGAAFKIYLD